MKEALQQGLRHLIAQCGNPCKGSPNILVRTRWGGEYFAAGEATAGDHYLLFPFYMQDNEIGHLILAYEEVSGIEIGDLQQSSKVVTFE